MRVATRPRLASLRTVRAIQMREFGGPEVLEAADLPVPEPADGEVLIEVARAGLNFADTHTTSNSYVRKASLPLVPGAEVPCPAVRRRLDVGGDLRAQRPRSSERHRTARL